MAQVIKIITKNTLAQLTAKFVGVGLTFLTTILILKQGGSPLFGDLTKTLALLAIGYTAIDFGLNAQAVRTMGKSERDQLAVFASTLLSRLVLSALVVVTLNVLVWLLPGGYTLVVKQSFFIGSLSILFHGVYISANTLFQRRLLYWRSSLALILGTVVGTIATYFVLLHSPTLFSLLLASTFGYFVLAVTSLTLLGWPRLQFSLFKAWRHFRSSLWLGATLVASILASRLDTVILGIFRSSSEVASYGLGYRAFEVVLTLPTFAMNAVFPLLFDLSAPRRRLLLKNSLLWLVVFGLFAGFVLYLCAPLLLYIRRDLTGAVLALRLLAPSLPLFYASSPLMWALIAARRERTLFWTYLVAAVVNALLNLALTPRFGLVSAAALTGLTELGILISLLYYSRKRINNA